MSQIKITNGKALWQAAAHRFAVLSPEEQRAGIMLIRELARGEPVAVPHLAWVLGVPVGAVEALVKCSALAPLIYLGDSGVIQGALGLSVGETHHRLTVNGRTLWTWCAEDSLFIPELLGETAEIDSRDPETNRLVHLTVSPAGVEAVDPAGVVVSLVSPQTFDTTSAARIMATACHFIFFFASQASGERWQEKHADPETVLLTLDEAFAFGKGFNQHLFGAELRRLTEEVARTLR